MMKMARKVKRGLQAGRRSIRKKLIFGEKGRERKRERERERERERKREKESWMEER